MKAKGKYNFSDELISKMRSYYEKGLKAEKIELPFFLPYESNNKSHLAFTLKIIGMKPQNLESKIPSNSSFNPIEKIEKILIN
jgi:hypothetical protein